MRHEGSSSLTRDQTSVLSTGRVVLTTGPPEKSLFFRRDRKRKSLITYLFSFTQSSWFIGMWSQLLPNVNWLELVRATDLKTGFVCVQWMTLDVRKTENCSQIRLSTSVLNMQMNECNLDALAQAPIASPFPLPPITLPPA